jgi:hypothetical protein
MAAAAAAAEFLGAETREWPSGDWGYDSRRGLEE